MVRTDFALPADQNAVFDTGYGGIHIGRPDRALAQGKVHTAPQLVDIELNTRAIALDDGRHDQFDPLVRGETPIALSASAPPPYRVAFLGNPGVDDLCIEAITERAFHCDVRARRSGRARPVSAIYRQARREFIDARAHA